MNTKTELDILTYLINSGTIDLDEVQNQVNNMKNDKYLSEHPYTIYYSESDERWHSYLPDDTKKTGRKPIAKKDKNKLEEAIIKFYKDKEDNNLTVKECYKGWIEEKTKEGEEEISLATVNRYDSDFNRFFKSIEAMKMAKVTEEVIIDFCKHSILTHKLDAKGFAKVKALLRGVCGFAWRKKIINYNIKDVLDNMGLSKTIFTVHSEDITKQCFNELEVPVILDFLSQSNNMKDLGLLLLFKTGLRVGELAALETTDIVNGTITIRKTETKVKPKGEKHFRYEIKNSPKTKAGYRQVIVPQDSLWLLEKILSRREELNTKNNNFLFLDENGNRIKTYSFRKRLYTISDCLFCNKRSPHKIRKTYCSILLDNKVPENIITSQVGHVHIDITKDWYYKQMKTQETKRNILDKALA